MQTSKDVEVASFSDFRYKQFFEIAKSKVLSARIQAAKSVCHEQMKLYWWLGKHIAQTQEKNGWGKSVVDSLSKDLKKTVGGKFGFSVQNLWYMRQFYQEYKDYPNLQQLVGEIPWGQNLVIFSKIKDIAAREYYLNAVKQMGWTRNTLTIQIKAQVYERHILAQKQHNFEQALPEHLAEQADRAMKDIYMLDMLGLTKPVLENQLEAGMVNKIKDVMLEMGYGFTFVGQQYRLVSASGTESFIDLLFFNRRLKCLFAMELKSGRFKPEYAGKMNYYLNLLDDLVKEEWENPSIGLVLCAERDHIDVEYTLRGINKPIGVAEFRLTKDLPDELTEKLPNAQKIRSEILRELGEIDSLM